MWSYVALGFFLTLSPLALAACGKGATTVNYGHEVCERKVIFEDDFAKDIRALNKNWKFVTRLSSYPDHEFNYYGQSKDTLSVSNGTLTFSPTLIPQIKDNDEFLYNGEINLNEYPPNSKKCSKNPDSEFCKRKASGYQILPPIMTTRIFSRKSFRYGTVEVRAKVPKGDWIYPEIELIPLIDQSRYGKKSGRIIIAMVRGNEDLRYPGTDERINFGVKWLEAGIVAGRYDPRSATHMVASINETAWSDDFHTFRVEWQPGKLSFFVDDELIGKGTIKTEGLLAAPMSVNAPADEEMVVALGIGVGGIQRFPDGVLSNGLPKPWKNLSPKALLNFWSEKSSWLSTWTTEESSLKIDYVRVWSRDVTKASLQARPRP